MLVSGKGSKEPLGELSNAVGDKVKERSRTEGNNVLPTVLSGPDRLPSHWEALHQDMLRGHLLSQPGFGTYRQVEKHT